jgi:hypothetical protein
MASGLELFRKAIADARATPDRLRRRDAQVVAAFGNQRRTSMEAEEVLSYRGRELQRDPYFVLPQGTVIGISLSDKNGSRQGTRDFNKLRNLGLWLVVKPLEVTLQAYNPYAKELTFFPTSPSLEIRSRGIVTTGAQTRTDSIRVREQARSDIAWEWIRNQPALFAKVIEAGVDPAHILSSLELSLGYSGKHESGTVIRILEGRPMQVRWGDSS